MCVAIPGWTLGTLAGAVSGSLLPDFLGKCTECGNLWNVSCGDHSTGKENRAVLGVVIGAMAVSTLFAVVPVLNKFLPDCDHYHDIAGSRVGSTFLPG